MQITDVPSTVGFYTGSGRPLHLLAPRTPRRKMGDRALRMHERGKTYQEIADSLEIAVSTAHRLVRAAQVSREVEQGKRDREIRRLMR